MNFSEWCLQTSKELGLEADEDLVRRVLLTAIRTGLEELSANPIHADLDITGIGRFYLNYRIMHNNFYHLKEGAEEYVKKWEIHFKPSVPLKYVLNQRKPLTDLLVGGNYIYPEFHTDENGFIIKHGQITDKNINDKTIRHSNEYWLKKIAQIQKGDVKMLPDGKFEKRGRPPKKRSIEQVRSKVMEEMRRDLRRELRWERQGKITKDDWGIAKW